MTRYGHQDGLRARLAPIFEHAAVGGIVLSLVMAATAVTNLTSIPPQSEIFKDRVYEQVVENFPAPPQEGTHDVRIDFGRAAQEASDSFFGRLKLHAALLGGSIVMGAGSGWVLSRRGYVP